MHDLSKSFLEDLKKVDRDLGAVYDSQDDAIYIHALRQGQKVHELAVKRAFAENYEELEHRTIKRLQECDVWKRFGSGKAYDDYLAQEEERFNQEKKKKFKDERIAWFKENREMVRAAVWNAQNGRFTRETALPFQTASVSFSGAKTDEPGYIVVDKRKRITEPITDLKGQGE